MKKGWLMLLIVLVFWGCEEKTDVNSPPVIPPLIEAPGEDQNPNQEERLAISKKAMEIFATKIGKRPEEMTREDLLEITSFFVTSEEEVDISRSLKALENLEELFIYQALEDYSFIQDLKNLKYLFITNGPNGNLSFLSGLEHLLEVYLLTVSDADFTPLSSAKNLKSLTVNHTNKMDIARLPEWNQLETLTVGADVIENLQALNNYPKLKSLSLYSIETFSGSLSTLNLPELEVLEIFGNGIEGTDFLGQLPNLKHLELNGPFDDLASFANFFQLTTLYVKNSNITDLTPLANLRQLKELDLSGSAVSDLSPLANLHQLEELNIQNTKVTSIQPLLELPNLRRITLTKKNVTDWEELHQVFPNIYIRDAEN